MDNKKEEKCDIPNSLLIKLYDATGNNKGSNKGFYLFFINKDGDPNCVSRTEDGATRLALISLVKDYKKMLGGELFEIDD